MEREGVVAVGKVFFVFVLFVLMGKLTSVFCIDRIDSVKRKMPMQEKVGRNCWSNVHK